MKQLREVTSRTEYASWNNWTYEIWIIEIFRERIMKYELWITFRETIMIVNNRRSLPWIESIQLIKIGIV